MTRADWTAIAGAVRTVRKQANASEMPILDAVTAELAKTLAKRSTRFHAETFKTIAGAA